MWEYQWWSQLLSPVRIHTENTCNTRIYVHWLWDVQIRHDTRRIHVLQITNLHALGQTQPTLTIETVHPKYKRNTLEYVWNTCITQIRAEYTYHDPWVGMTHASQHETDSSDEEMDRLLQLGAQGKWAGCGSFSYSPQGPAVHARGGAPSLRPWWVEATCVIRRICMYQAVFQHSNRRSPLYLSNWTWYCVSWCIERVLRVYPMASVERRIIQCITMYYSVFYCVSHVVYMCLEHSASYVLDTCNTHRIHVEYTYHKNMSKYTCNTHVIHM